MTRTRIRFFEYRVFMYFIVITNEWNFGRLWKIQKYNVFTKDVGTYLPTYLPHLPVVSHFVITKLLYCCRRHGRGTSRFFFSF